MIGSNGGSVRAFFGHGMVSGLRGLSPVLRNGYGIQGQNCVGKL